MFLPKKCKVNDETVALSIAEFEGIKAKMLALEAEMARLLAPPQVFATVLEVAPKLLVEDGIQKAVVIYDGKLFEVEASPGTLSV